MQKKFMTRIFSYCFVAIFLFIFISPLSNNVSAQSCPSTPLSTSATVEYVGLNEIQPGTYNPTVLNIQINPTEGGTAYFLCGQNTGVNFGTVIAPDCPFEVYPCSQTPPPTCPMIHQSPGSPDSVGPGLSGSSGILVYMPGNETPGSYTACYMVCVTPDYVSAGLLGPTATTCPVEPIQGESSPPSNYLVLNTTQPNTQTGNPGQPDYFVQGTGGLSMNVFPTPTPVEPQNVTFTLQGDGQYPLSLELAQPSAGIYCQYGGVPTSGGTTLPQCPTVPQPGDIPCSIASTQGTGASQLVSKLSTDLLGSEKGTQYDICGYEGYPPNSGGNPWPVFFTQQTITVTCPITGCNNAGLLLPNPNLGLLPIQQAVCTLYYEITEFLILLAIVLVLIGAVLYAGSSLVPGYTRGTIQGYAMGLILAGVVSIIISVVSVFFLSLGANTPVQTILALNGCQPVSIGTSTPTTAQILYCGTGNGCNAGPCPLNGYACELDSPRACNGHGSYQCVKTS